MPISDSPVNKKINVPIEPYIKPQEMPIDDSPTSKSYEKIEMPISDSPTMKKVPILGESKSEVVL